VSRHAPVGYVFSRVFARDADFAHNARLRYQLVSVDGRPSDAGRRPRLFDVDADLGAVSVAGDLLLADVDRHDLVLAVIDGGVPPRSAVVTLTVNLVSTAWTERNAGVGDSARGDGDRRARTVADVFHEHRLILAVLAVATVSLTVLLVLAIVCINCRQVRTS